MNVFIAFTDQRNKFYVFYLMMNSIYDIISASRLVKWLVTQLFVEQPVKANNKEHVKVQNYCVVITQRANNVEMFSCHDTPRIMNALYCPDMVQVNLPISFRVTSLALGQSYDCPSACEATLKYMDKLVT